MSQKYFYFPFYPKANVNYVYLCLLSVIAEYDTELKSNSIIKYESIYELSQRIGISESTLNRVLSCRGRYEDYNKFLQVDKKKKTITLLNSFAGKRNVSYVSVPAKDILLLLQKECESMMILYYLYLRFYCGRSKSKKTDSTAKQFLDTCGYSTNSNALISKISTYNAILAENGLIQITKYRDDKQHIRNVYTVNS